ncbi:MAG: CHASE2 domain-containing protein [Cyclobacteriaceae bacterium]
MFRKFWLDTILGTLFILGLMGFLNNITQLKIFEMFDPIGEALSDVKLTDLVYSQIREPLPVQEDILLVNIGLLPRAGLGEVINIINKHDPKVIGVDTFFRVDKDSLGDAMLEEAFSKVENLVLVNKLLYNPSTDEFDSLDVTLSRYTQYADIGFANLIAPGAQGQDDLKNTREFAVQEKAAGDTYEAFGVKLVEKYAPEKAEKFIARGNDVEVINYRGNVMDFGATRYGTTFFALDFSDVFMENFDPSVIKDKIVILCFMGSQLGDRLSTEDKYYTPINAKYAGKSDADMFGGVIHANIVAMILNEDYVDRMSEFQSNLTAVLILFLNVVLFSLIYKTIPTWYDGSTKLIQIIEVLVLMYLTIQIFDSLNYELDLTFAIIAVAISGDALEVYYGVIKNLLSKQGRKELTKIKKL